MNRETVIVAYGRSALCRARKGSFAGVHPVEYSAQVLKGVLAQIPQLDPADIEDVIMGCAVQHHTTSMNVAKKVASRAQLPESVCAHTINRFCSSGLQAIATASNTIAAGQGDVVIAGGVEDMSGTFEPYPVEDQDQWLVEHDPGAYMEMGITAENIVKKYGLTRVEMDQMAVESHQKAARAQIEGKLAPSIIPVTVTDAQGNPKVVTLDEGIRPGSTLETLGNLQPCFIPETGTVTAGTSSQVTDGAAFVVLMEAEKAKNLGIKPLARLRSFAVAGCDATVMGLGPVYAVPKALKRAGLSMDDMDVIELNEAFAAQAIACIRELKMDPEKINPYGGAMALGHPMGATGAVLTCKALDYLRDQNETYGLVTMCIGGGMGAAGIFEILR
ncbi:MAG: thiolase family protein [Clostridiales bacterium]|nr:thiolase family protein [Clostridiales bacterium]